VARVRLLVILNCACFSALMQTYGIVTSLSEPCSKIVQLVGDGEKEFEQPERGMKVGVNI
jgi:hypothetical protein